MKALLTEYTDTSSIKHSVVHVFPNDVPKSALEEMVSEVWTILNECKSEKTA